MTQRRPAARAATNPARESSKTTTRSRVRPITRPVRRRKATSKPSGSGLPATTSSAETTNSKHSAKPAADRTKWISDRMAPDTTAIGTRPCNTNPPPRATGPPQQYRHGPASCQPADRQVAALPHLPDQIGAGAVRKMLGPIGVDHQEIGGGSPAEPAPVPL